MADNLAYKYWRDPATGMVDAGVYNVPYGNKEISFDEFINAAKDQYSDNSYGKGVSFYDYIKNSSPKASVNPNALIPGGTSNYTTYTNPQTGQTDLIKKTDLDQMNKDANDPNLTNIGTADKPMYVPKGSAGEALAKSGFPNTAGQTTPTTTQTGTSNASTGGQIYRDNNNNFFSVDANGNKTAITQAQFQQMGLNEKFVQPGQTVSMQQATTGNAGTNGTNGSNGTNGTSGGNTGGTNTSGVATDTTGAPNTLTPDQMRANLASILPASMIGTIPDNMLASFSAWADMQNQQSKIGLQNADIQASDLAKSIASIANDPQFIAKYGDQLKLSTATFQNNVQQLQQQAQTTAQQQQQQFTDQQKAAAEKAAAQGQAYSGFREQAKQRLASDQSGIIESTRSQIKNSLTGLGQSWEGMFGSKAAQTPGVDYTNPLTGVKDTIAYNPLGGITGSVPLQKQQEMDSQGISQYQNIKLPDLSAKT